MFVASSLRILAVLALSTILTIVPSDRVHAASGEFDGAGFSCLDYTNGLGQISSKNIQSILGRLWVQGYLAGLYKAQDKLELSEDPQDAQRFENLMLQRCRDNPETTIMGVALRRLAPEDLKLPAKAIADFSPATHTCGQQVEARDGTAGDATKADLADLWAFAFIQGFKNAVAEDMVIAMDNKSVLIDAVSRYCAGNRDMAFMDMTALIAEKVKLQEEAK